MLCSFCTIFHHGFSFVCLCVSANVCARMCGRVCMLTAIHQNSTVSQCVCICVSHQIYACRLLCDWPRDSSGRPSGGVQALYLVRRAIRKIRHTRFTPQLRTGRWEGSSQDRICLNVLSLCLPLLPSLLPTRQVMDMWRSLIPYSPERGGIHHPLPLPPLRLSSSHPPSGHSTISCLSN